MKVYFPITCMILLQAFSPLYLKLKATSFRATAHLYLRFTLHWNRQSSKPVS